jgi:hypothetical protein
MVSEVSICNRALALVGHEPITSFADQSKASEWCRSIFPGTRDDLLACRPWPFAMDKTVSESNDKDKWTRFYIHPLPPGWMRPHAVYVGERPQQQISAWELRGTNVESPYPRIWMEGVTRVSDTGKFPPMFTEVLALRLASQAALALTGNLPLHRELLDMAEKQLVRAAELDGHRISPRYEEVNPLISGRYHW